MNLSQLAGVMCGHQGTLTGELVARQNQVLQGCALGEIWNWACIFISSSAGLMSEHQDALTLEGIVVQIQSLQGCALGEIWDQACIFISSSARLMCEHQVMFTPDNPQQGSLISVTRPLWSKVTPAGLHAATSPSVIVGSSLSQPSLLSLHVA